MPCVTDNSELVTHTPLVPTGQSPACGIDTIPPECKDPLYALDHPGTCANYSPLTTLEIVPDEGTIETGSTFGYRAIAHFENGLSADVSELALWSSSNTGIGAVTGQGLFLGISEGTTGITAAWHGLFDNAILNVSLACYMYGLDVAIVLSRAASMNLCDNGPSCAGSALTRLQKAKLAVANMVGNLKVDDQVAVISFGGIIRFNDDGSVTKFRDARFEQTLTTDRTAIQAAVDAVQSNNPCTTATALNCATGIGGGLDLGMQELTGPRARSGAVKKVLVLLTDGVEQICDPDPVTVAAAAKAADILIIIVALDVPDVDFVDCSSATVGSHNFLVDLSSFGLAYFEDNNGLTDIFSRIPNIICEGHYGYGYYNYIYPASHHYKDQLDYTGFLNWNVAYCVDLIGRDLYVFPALVGHGAYVDLCGTSCPHPGGLISKTLFHFEPGQYRLSMQLAGNQRTDYSAKGGDRVGIIISTGSNPSQNAVNTVVTILNKNQPFQLYQFDFNIAGPMDGYIEIKELPFAPQFQTQPGAVLPVVVGALVNDILLQNLTSGDIMLDDTFDNENLV